MELLEKNREVIAANFMFRNTQDTRLAIERIERNQAQIVQQFRELVEYLKKKMGDDEQPQSGQHSFIG